MQPFLWNASWYMETAMANDVTEREDAAFIWMLFPWQRHFISKASKKEEEKLIFEDDDFTFWQIQPTT